jgi:hypothetical protein
MRQHLQTLRKTDFVVPLIAVLLAARAGLLLAQEWPF